MAKRICPPIGLQLFTIRDEMERDLFHALERIAAIGYQGVEFAGLFDHDPHRVAQHVQALGLKVAGVHQGLERLFNSTEECIAELRTLGSGIAIIPYLTDDWRTEAGYRLAVEQMLTIARRLKPHGIRLCYHHHSFEFETLSRSSARRGIDIILEAPADQLLLEADVYWARHGGTDPIRFLRKHIRRTPLVHLKDMKDAISRQFAEIGAGILDFKQMIRLLAAHSSLAAGQESGCIEWMLVEQDGDFAVSSMASVKQSYDALKDLCNQAAAGEDA